MNHKVLLADDSLTIQKVIKITLANQPFDITDCSNEDELFKQLPVVQPKFVFLDFNLSEKFTGYELTTKIKSICPSAKVLLLLGTFDSVDDAAMEKCGASDKIVKPFDSNKFIAICKQLIETFADGDDIPFPEAKEDIPAPIDFDSEDDQWTVNHTTEQKLPKMEDLEMPTEAPSENPLMKEMSEWGMSVPGVIGDQTPADKQIDLPPVIETVQAQKPELVHDNQKFPDNDDLDYPTIEEMSASEGPAETTPAPETKPTTSKLISIDSFKDSADDFQIEHSFEDQSQSDVSSIEAQIRDEVEDNLWQADEFEDLKKEVSAKIEEVKNNFEPSAKEFDDSFFKPLDDKDSIEWSDVADTVEESFTAAHPAAVQNIDKSEIEAMVKKYVKEYMDEMFKQDVEKVAWEVIPDLAENLIRQELSKIANKIINE